MKRLIIVVALLWAFNSYSQIHRFRAIKSCIDIDTVDKPFDWQESSTLIAHDLDKKTITFYTPKKRTFAYYKHEKLKIEENEKGPKVIYRFKLLALDEEGDKCSIVLDILSKEWDNDITLYILYDDYALIYIASHID